MDRRSFMAASAVTLVMPLAAQAAEHYKPGLVKQLLADGKTVVIDFTTEWCTTCAAQKRTMAAVRQSNPAYDENIIFVTSDYDIYGQKELARELNIPRRSTIVALKGEEELARIVAGTSKKQIKELLDAALTAAIA